MVGFDAWCRGWNTDVNPGPKHRLCTHTLADVKVLRRTRRIAPLREV